MASRTSVIPIEMEKLAINQPSQINYIDEIKNRLKYNGNEEDFKFYAMFLQKLSGPKKLGRVVANLTESLLSIISNVKPDLYDPSIKISRSVKFMTLEDNNTANVEYKEDIEDTNIIDNYIKNFLIYHLTNLYFTNPKYTGIFNFIINVFDCVNLSNYLKIDNVYLLQYIHFLIFITNINKAQNRIGSEVMNNGVYSLAHSSYGDDCEFTGEGGFNIKDIIINASKKYKSNFPKSIVEMYCSKYITNKISNNSDNIDSNQLVDILSTHLNKSNTNLKIEKYVSDLKNVIESLQLNSRKYKFNNSDDEE